MPKSPLLVALLLAAFLLVRQAATTHFPEAGLHRVQSNLFPLPVCGFGCRI